MRSAFAFAARASASADFAFVNHLEPVFTWMPATREASVIVLPAAIDAKNLALSAGDTDLFVPMQGVYFFRAAAMLSIRFGYGRPAFFARAIAFFFSAGVNLDDFFFGFFVSQTIFFFAAIG